MEKYFLTFRKVTTTKGKIEYDTWITSKTCNSEYIGQYSSQRAAHTAVKTMLKNKILF